MEDPLSMLGMNALTMLNAVETAIMGLVSGAEEMHIGSRSYRKSELDKLRILRQNLYDEVFYANLAPTGYTTRAYAAWPLRKVGIPPWTSIGPSTEL